MIDQIIQNEDINHTFMYIDNVMIFEQTKFKKIVLL